MQAAVAGRFGVQQQARRQRADGGDLVGQLLGAGCVHGQVEPEAVELAFAPGDAGGQLVGVLGGGFHVRVAQPAFLLGVAAVGFELGELPLEAGAGGDRVDRLDVHADVHPARVGQQGLQPSG
ncbi:hypothetical protein SVIO_102820 [Streptomyces violaceusniger]|uniref:Uncharacterized protein n=1 Tax=Streptomyces violaceusniger TaxID=68280 RepID=A0A4D4LP46_STRVO|nr:hypothetical protein SVIO_102820 [Streptomyces violaceusniger]